MQRRTGIALFLIFGLLALWVATKDVTIHRGAALDPRAGTVRQVYLGCGDVIPIVFESEYAEGLPHFWRATCTRAARTEFAFLLALGGLSVGFGIAGLRGRPGPRYRPIDSVLPRLPSAEELRIWATDSGPPRR